MRVGVTRNRIVFVLVIVLVCGSFVYGFLSSLHLRAAASSDLRSQYLLQAGDAPPSVRAGVLVALRVFQEGYLKRDPNTLDSFMSRLFSEKEDVLLMGTDANEWVRGYRAVREFIKADWLYWGDFRLAVDDCIVWSSGDVAWIASIGVVRSKGLDRPVRFSAVLVRNGPDWLFRNVYFQWDERDPRPSDLLNPRTHLKLVESMLQRIRNIAERWMVAW